MAYALYMVEGANPLNTLNCKMSYEKFTFRQLFPTRRCI